MLHFLFFVVTLAFWVFCGFILQDFVNLVLLILKCAHLEIYRTLADVFLFLRSCTTT